MNYLKLVVDPMKISILLSVNFVKDLYETIQVSIEGLPNRCGSDTFQDVCNKLVVIIYKV